MLDNSSDVRDGLRRDGFGFEARLADDARSAAVPAARKARLGSDTCWILAGREAAILLNDRARTARVVPPDLPCPYLATAPTTYGPEHDQQEGRRQVQLRVLDPVGTDQLARALDEHWAALLPGWMAAGEIDLHTALVELLARAAFSWVGIGDQEDIPARGRDLAAAIGEGQIWPPGSQRHDASAQHRCMSWAVDTVRRARERADLGHEPLRRIVAATDADGALWAEDVAADELLSLLRSIVAIAWWGAFIPLAFTAAPDWRKWIDSDGQAQTRKAFVHELRRHYPFVPVIPGVARQSFRWFSHHIREGDWVMLLVVPTNHDPRVWDEPWQFQPERFLTKDPDPYAMVAQGVGGDESGRRCPGESATMRLLEHLVQHLADLGFELATPARFPVRPIPTVPEGGPRILLGQIVREYREHLNDDAR